MPQIKNKSICCESTQWRYLETNPKSWRKQLFIKGTNIKASSIWLDFLLESFTPEELADDRDISVESVKEAIKYCNENQQLLEQEAQEELLELKTIGICIS